MPLPLAAMGAGAALGGLSSLFGGGDQTSTSTQSIGQADQDYLSQGRNFALAQLARGMGGLDPGLLAAMQGYGGYADAGRMGLAAFTDPSIMARFMAFNQGQAAPIFERQRAQLAQQHASRMAGARAFGVRGQMMGPNYGDINNAELMFNLQNAQNAQGIASQLANFGQFGIAGQHNLGQYMTERPMNWAQQMTGILSGNYGGPFSQTTTSTQPGQGGNFLQGALGGAMMGMSFGGRPSAPAGVDPLAGIRAQGYGSGTYTPWQPPAFNPAPMRQPTGFGQ